MQIRPATREDVPEILALIRELAAYEREPEAVEATEQDLLRDGFGPSPRFSALVALEADRTAGLALYFFNWSTWRGRPGIHLEDLFVRPAFRGQGIGRALLARVAGVALENGCARLQWDVLEWNQPAIDFYRGLGAAFLDEWRIMRLTDEALTRLAKSLPQPVQTQSGQTQSVQTQSVQTQSVQTPSVQTQPGPTRL